MGSTWKMPTKDQCKELIDGTNSEWITLNGVNGGKFTSKTDSTKYIFLPAGGVWILSNYRNEGTYGQYWSITSNDSLWKFDLIFTSNRLELNSNGRQCGQSVRAI